MCVAFIKTSAVVRNYAFEYCCDTKPVDTFSCSGGTLPNALVSWMNEISDFST